MTVQGHYLSNLNQNVSPRLKFWDEVEEFPAIHLNAGSETREYQGRGHKDRFLSLTIRCYVQAEDSVAALDDLLEDVETVIEENSRLGIKIAITQINIHNKSQSLVLIPTKVYLSL